MTETAPDPPAPGDSNASSPSAASSEPAASEDETDPSGGAVCQNCGTPIHGDYCHSCGQRHVPRLRARELAKHFADSLLNVADLRGTLWVTLLEGARNPGRLARRYVEGEREHFVNPISYFLIAVTFSFLLLTVLRAEWVGAMTEMSKAQWAAMGVDPKVMFGPEGMYRKAFGWSSIRDSVEVIFRVVKQILTYANLLFCLAAAGLLLPLSSGYTFAELVVFELYVLAQANLFFVLAAPIILLFGPAMLLFGLGLLLKLGIFAWAGRSFLGTSVKDWLLPPLTYVGGYVAVVLTSTLLGIVIMSVYLLWTLGG